MKGAPVGPIRRAFSFVPHSPGR